MKEIGLSRGLATMVDDCDFEELSKYKWNAANGKYTHYAIRTENGKAILMHRQILKINDRRVFCDHIDGDGLNNCRNNLRQCTVEENNMNKRGYKNNVSGTKGLQWIESQKGWSVRITHKKNLIYLGCFKDKTTAIQAYNNKAIELHGRFARLSE